MAAFERGPFGRDEMTRWVERNLAHQRRHGYGLFSVIHKAEGLIIGDCGLEHRDIQGRAEIELGYDFRSAYWRRGLATEAAIAVRDYAFENLKIERLVSLIRRGNAASRRVAEKVGMRREYGFGRERCGVCAIRYRKRECFSCALTAGEALSRSLNMEPCETSARGRERKRYGNIGEGEREVRLMTLLCRPAANALHATASTAIPHG